MAIATGKSTSDLAGGLYQTISAFGDTAETVKLLELNARAAAAGLATTEEAINLTSAVTKGYGDTSAKAVEHVSDLALQTVKLGQTTFPELAAAMGRVVPLAAELKVSQEELFAVMATATGVTGGAAEVSTQLRGVLQSLLAPTGDMTKLLGSMGFASGRALLEQKGLMGAIETVTDAATKTGEPLQKYISSIEGQTLALALAGPQADTYKQKLAEMADASGTLDEAFKAQTGGVNAAGFAWAQFQQKLAVLSQRLGDQLAPALAKALDAAQPLIDFAMAAVNWFAKLDPALQTAAIGLLGVGAAVGPVLYGVGQLSLGISSMIGIGAKLLPLLGTGGLSGALATVTGFLTGPVGIAVAIGAAAVALGVFLSKNKEVVDAVSAVWATWGPTITSFFKRLWDGISAIFSAVWTTIKGVVSGALDVIVGGIQVFAGVVTLDWGLFAKGVRNIWEGLWTAIKAYFAAPVEYIKSTVKGLTTSVTGFFAGMYDAVIGHSSVPDLISGIGTEFAKLPAIMVAPAANATKEVKAAFATFREDVDQTKRSILGITVPTAAWQAAFLELVSAGKVTNEMLVANKDSIMALSDSQHPLIGNLKAMIPLIGKQTSEYEASNKALEDHKAILEQISKIPFDARTIRTMPSSREPDVAVPYGRDPVRIDWEGPRQEAASFWDNFRQGGISALQSIMAATSNWGNALSNVFEAIGGKAQRIVDGVIEGVKTAQSIAGKFASGDIVGGIIEAGAALANLFTGLIGRGRRMADEFVKEVQNPMGEAVTHLFDALEAARATGTLTVAGVGTARSSINKMWADFQEAAKGYGKVGDQALATVGPMIAGWGRWLDGLEVAAAELEHMSDVLAIVNRVAGAANGWQVMEQGIQTLMDTGLDWAAILDIMGGDVKSMAHNMELLGIAIPPAMQSLLNAGDAMDAFAKQAQEAADATERAAQEAAEALQRNKDRLRDVESEIADVRQQTAEAILHKFEYLESEIENSLGSIDKWRDGIREINEEITEAATKLSDNKYWLEEYNKLISDQADEVKRLLDLRKSTEEKIADLELQVQRDKYAAAIEAAKLSKDTTALAVLERNLDFFEANVRKSERAARLAELNRLQNELPEIIHQQEVAAIVMQQTAEAARKEIAARQQDLKTFIDTKAAERLALQANIAVEQQRIVLLNQDKAATQALMDIMGITRLSEIDKINLSIVALVERGIALVEERDALGELLSVAQDGIDVFHDLASAIGDAIAAASMPPAVPPPPAVVPPGTPPPAGGASGPPPNLSTAELIDYYRRQAAGLPQALNGMDFVPREMPTIVHPEEAILNKSDARDWRSGQSGNTTKIETHMPITIHVHESKNPQDTARVVVEEIERLMGTGQNGFNRKLRKATDRPR